MDLKINRVVIKEVKGIRYAFYLTIAKVGVRFQAFWSHHKCEGMSDKQAGKAFTREHFNEVAELVLQKIKHQLIN